MIQVHIRIFGLRSQGFLHYLPEASVSEDDMTGPFQISALVTVSICSCACFMDNAYLILCSYCRSQWMLDSFQWLTLDEHIRECSWNLGQKAISFVFNLTVRPEVKSVSNLTPIIVPWG